MCTLDSVGGLGQDARSPHWAARRPGTRLPAGVGLHNVFHGNNLGWIKGRELDSVVEPLENGYSLLKAVADREGALLARVADAEREARAIVEAARTEAAARTAASERRLGEELAGLRREAESARAEAAAAIRAAAREKLDRLRGKAEERAEEIVAEVVGLVMPPETGGGAP